LVEETTYAAQVEDVLAKIEPRDGVLEW